MGTRENGITTFASLLRKVPNRIRVFPYVRRLFQPEATLQSVLSLSFEKKFNREGPGRAGQKKPAKKGPELSPRKSGRCARFARATPCQCKKVRLFLPSDAQNRERRGRVNHKP